jgi:hypothetical protein
MRMKMFAAQDKAQPNLKYKRLKLGGGQAYNRSNDERHDLLCKACTDRGLVYSAKGIIFNNMLYMRYIHLTKGQAYS